MMKKPIAYITAITNAKYLKGLKVLAKSLSATKTVFSLSVIMPEEHFNGNLYKQIKKMGLEILLCPKIDIPLDYTKTNMNNHWNETFFKLNIANLTQFEKIVFLDSDMLILKNIDHLFSFPSISATIGGKSAHPEWMEFNSGIMVVEPSAYLYEGLMECIIPASERRRALGLGYGDQDVFNQFYPEWKTCSGHNFGELYNVLHCFVDAYVRVHGKRSYQSIHVLHFIGSEKIWNKSMIQLIRMFHGLFHDRKFYEIRACLKYLKYLYF